MCYCNLVVNTLSLGKFAKLINLRIPLAEYERFKKDPIDDFLLDLHSLQDIVQEEVSCSSLLSMREYCQHLYQRY